jgi:SAM-dependent methyltransferase
MISTDDVIVAYRLLLGREPEDPAMVEAYAHSISDLASLRKHFLYSEEFAAANVMCLPSSLDYGKPLRIDVNVNTDLLLAMLDRVEHTWHRLGFTQPFWSVLSRDEFKRDKFDENSAAFYTSGQKDVLRLNAWLKRNGITELGNGHVCCEYGCGTGRVTFWLAAQFSRVVACDISRPHLDLARDYLDRAGLSNVAFHQMDSPASLSWIEAVDLVFSFIVLQHNPPPVIAFLLVKLLERLKPGGLAFFQVPTYRPNYEFEAENYLNQPPSEEIEMHVLPQKHVFAIAREQNCDVLEVQPDCCVGLPLWISNTFLLRKRSRDGR